VCGGKRGKWRTFAKGLLAAARVDESDYLALVNAGDKEVVSKEEGERGRGRRRGRRGGWCHAALSISHTRGHTGRARTLLDWNALTCGPVCVWERGACVWGGCRRARAIAITRMRARRARENSTGLGCVSRLESQMGHGSLNECSFLEDLVQSCVRGGKGKRRTCVEGYLFFYEIRNITPYHTHLLLFSVEILN